MIMMVMKMMMIIITIIVINWHAILPAFSQYPANWPGKFSKYLLYYDHDHDGDEDDDNDNNNHYNQLPSTFTRIFSISCKLAWEVFRPRNRNLEVE